MSADNASVSGSQPAIHTEALTRRFGEHTAVDSLSLCVETGEIFGFLGPNGAGKTTTLRMLSTLIPPTAGSARVLGHDLLDDPMAIRRGLGVMTERPGLYERLSVDANLRLWAEAHQVPDPAAAIARALDFVDLSDRRDAPVASLSKGLKQRAALARAVVHSPRLLLLDEPSSGLDPAASVHVEAMIRSLADRGTTVFLSTHRLAEAQRLCDRVAILNTRLIAVGSPSELRSRFFGNTVTVRLDAPVAPAILDAARETPGVLGVRAERASFDCRLEDAGRDTPRLVAAVVAAGGGVLEVAPAGDLEQVYLDLVGAGTPGSDSPEMAA